MQQPMNSFTTFSTYLNQEDSPVRNKVISIVYDYRNSYYSINNNKSLIDGSTYMNDEIVKAYCTSDATLFKLTGDHSPFSRKESNENGAPVTKYFQYLMIVKNSSEVTPYDPTN